MEETNTAQTNQSKATAKTPLAVGAVIAAVAVGAVAYPGMMGKKTTTQPESMPSTNPDSTTPAVSAKDYKDGTYNVVGTYTSPAGPEEIKVTLTIEKNLVTAATVEPMATNQFSKKWQGTFKDNFKDMVIGKDINTLKLDRVSGSSLTPKGFNDAIEKVKAQATS